MIRFAYAPDLVEESVLLAERTVPPADSREFRRGRDRLYAMADQAAREAAFQALHLRWFGRFGLHRTIECLVDGRTDVAGGVSCARVRRAYTRHDEGADLVDEPVSDGVRATISVRPSLILRLQPATLLDRESLTALLHHELMHVGDMLAPSFGYERSLPASPDGPSADNMVRDRYRVLWDVTIDGRLAGRGLAGAGVREARQREFAATFSMLGDGCHTAFDRWFEEKQPTHRELLAFATQPEGLRGEGRTGRCPLCRFPVASLDPRIGQLPVPVAAAIRDDHPKWTVEHGLCPQCFDLYEARYGDRRNR
jgi:hypothetical protein